MTTQDHRISLADLSAAGVRLTPTEAATIARDLMRMVGACNLPGVPSAHVIRIAPGGALTIEGPVAAGDRAVWRAAQLLDALLPGFDAAPGVRVPGPLRLAVARGLGALDIPPYPSLESFADALDRFAASDSETLIRDLAARWIQASGQAASSPADTSESASVSPPQDRPALSGPSSQVDPALGGAREQETSQTLMARGEAGQLTISDIRRARRSSGLPLMEISERSRIPVHLLRQLEWGYLHNWPRGLYGRTQLVRYARAAGLDEHLVLEIVWPMLGETIATEATEVIDAEPVGSVVDLANFNLTRVGEQPPPASRRRRRFAAVVGLTAAAAVIVLAMLPALLERTQLPDLTGLRITTPTQQVEPQPSPPHAGPSAEIPAAQTGTARPAIATSGGASTSAAEPGTAEEPRPSIPAPVSSLADRGSIVDAIANSPALATEASATFQHADTSEPGALIPDLTDDAGALLRVTRVIDSQARNFHARPSPDGKLIAFDSDRDGERGVYIARADGSGVRRVSGPGFAAVPSWSPDGRVLALVRAERHDPAIWNLWTVDLGTGELTRLTSNRSGQPWGASWFPDGQRIVYSLGDRLIVLSLETGRQRVHQSPREGQLVRAPAVSPDGTLVIFQVYRDGAWLLDLEDGSMRKVLADPSAEAYTWSPDGRRVAYHSRASGEWGVWLMARR